MASKEVKFGESITIQEYPIELGDNPGCSAGAPIQIGWTPFKTTIRNLDLYEYCRGDRRRGTALLLSVPERNKILLRLGYSQEEIQDLTEAVTHARKQRAETVEVLQKQGSLSLSSLVTKTGKLPKDIWITTGRALRKMVQIKIPAASA